MGDKKNISAVAATVLFDIMADYGISVSRIEDAIGINHNLINDPDAQITMSEFLSLWQMAADMTKDPAIGLHLRDYYGSNLMHFVIIIALNSDTLLGAIQSWVRYDRLICEIIQIQIFEKKDHFIFTYTNTEPEFENHWIPEQYFSLAVEYSRRLSTKNIIPIEVWFRHDDPGYANAYHEVFQCPVLFGKKENLIRFKKKDLMYPIVSPDPYLKAVLEKHADKSIKDIGEPFSLKSRVADHIIKNLHTGQVTIQTVSDAMHMDRSTLYRHLVKEGTSFKELLMKIRKKLARSHLIKGLTATQTAYLLGFTEPSAFQRAFKRWFDQSPGEFKKAICS